MDLFIHDRETKVKDRYTITALVALVCLAFAPAHAQVSSPYYGSAQPQEAAIAPGAGHAAAPPGASGPFCTGRYRGCLNWFSRRGGDGDFGHTSSTDCTPRLKYCEATGEWPLGQHKGGGFVNARGEKRAGTFDTIPYETGLERHRN